MSEIPGEVPGELQGELPGGIPGDGAPQPSPADQLRGSARGWHGVQLGVLGFIGLCGVLQGDSGGDNPAWLEQLAAVLVVVALASACVATAVVAAVAWPLRPMAAQSMPAAERRLRLGVGLTYVAVLAMALSASSDWWPHPDTAALARVTTQSGSFCGELVASSQDGALTVVVAGQRVSLATRSVTGVEPVPAC